MLATIGFRTAAFLVLPLMLLPLVGSATTDDIFQATAGKKKVAEVILCSFPAGVDSLTGSVTRLLQGADGNFYGTSRNGGAYGEGAVFRVTPAGAVTLLYSFSGGIDGSTDGAWPNGPLIELFGEFYGTTAYGGTAGAGTVFKMTGTGRVTLLHSFTGGANGSSVGTTDGAYPLGSLLRGWDGNLYGVTQQGGAGSDKIGTVFRISRSGDEAVLHSFYAETGDDGGGPVAGLMQASDGNFYGTTESGGRNFAGTIFKMKPSGEETVLYDFEGNPSGTPSVDGSLPEASLIEGADHHLYGTTGYGGLYGGGIAFKVSLAGKETVLHSFGKGNDGVGADSPLLLASDGNFYGTTANGGAYHSPDAYGNGTAYKLTPAGVETVIYSFDYADGESVYGGLIEGKDHNLYGSSPDGGLGSNGAVFNGNVFKLVNVLPTSSDSR
jgi:uncharacterized repeat protein (TIGR03803 family)